MGSESWPVAITAIPGAAVGAVAWRAGGKLFVSAIVKASFAFVPGGVARRVEPEPIAVDEELDASGGLRAAGDLAPFLARADVWLTGNAPVPPGATGGVRVELAVAREGVVLLDKALDMALPEGEPPPATVRITGAAPLSKRWPVRRRLLGDVDPRRLEGRIVDIPEGFDWSYFHVVPPDQRIEPLRGDEGIRLTGMHPQYAVLATRLPGAQAQARLHAEMGALRAGRRIDLSATTLRIDVDRLLCSVTWRGYFPISGDDWLEKVHVVAGVAAPDQSLEWPDPFAGRASRPSSPEPAPVSSAVPSRPPPSAFNSAPASSAVPSRPPPPSQEEKTIDLSAFAGALPGFGASGGPPSTPDARGGDTMFLGMDEAPPPPPPPINRIPAIAPPPAGRAAAQPVMTEDLSEIAKLLPQNPLPFQASSASRAPASAPRISMPAKTPLAAEAPSTGTLDLSAVAKLLPQAPTPFERNKPPPSAPPPPPPPSTPGLSPQSASAPPPPFIMQSPSAPPPAPPLLTQSPSGAPAAPEQDAGGFGGAFLAAMGELSDEKK